MDAHLTVQCGGEALDLSDLLSEQAEVLREDDHAVLLARPTTLRAVLAAGIETDAQWGCTDEEHEELLDEAGLVRIVFGVRIAHGGPEDVPAYVETYCQRPMQEPTWSSCMRGYGDHRKAKINRARVRTLLHQIEPGAREAISQMHRARQVVSD